MRIDLIASDRELATRLDTTWIDHVGRSGERPSDHAALVADFYHRGRGARRPRGPGVQSPV
jgi:exonuclease III